MKNINKTVDDRSQKTLQNFRHSHYHHCSYSQSWFTISPFVVSYCLNINILGHLLKYRGFALMLISDRVTTRLITTHSHQCFAGAVVFCRLCNHLISGTAGQSTVDRHLAVQVVYKEQRSDCAVVGEHCIRDQIGHWATGNIQRIIVTTSKVGRPTCARTTPSSTCSSIHVNWV